MDQRPERARQWRHGMIALTDERQVALVTGSASGIGRSVTEALRDAGYIVFAGMRGVEGHNAGAARSLRTEGEDRVHPIEMDVLSEESCAAAGRPDLHSARTARRRGEQCRHADEWHGGELHPRPVPDDS
ncbi:SDR family NAD(P)-dependent oxidoreductase [Rhizobium mayense]|uniref:SDR family NAD(P)-dependent oxidoreductase n=1 Tax=Rhizobium mayense TaxID=1312184 RepID=UPI00398C3549